MTNPQTLYLVLAALVATFFAGIAYAIITYIAHGKIARDGFPLGHLFSITLFH